MKNRPAGAGRAVCRLSLFFSVHLQAVGSKEHAAGTELEPHKLPSPESGDAEGFCLQGKVQARLPVSPTSPGSPAKAFFPVPLVRQESPEETQVSTS